MPGTSKVTASKGQTSIFPLRTDSTQSSLLEDSSSHFDKVQHFFCGMATPLFMRDFKASVEGGAEPIPKPNEKPSDQTVSYVPGIHVFLVKHCSAVGESGND